MNSAPTIHSYTNCRCARVEAEIKEIFFVSSSRKSFKDETEREAFWQRWTSAYFTRYPEGIFLAMQGDRVVAYLMSCPNSEELRDYYRETLPSYEVFSDLFLAFPAHLHINTAPESRGLGIGQILIHKLEIELMKQGVNGLHLVTGSAERNTSFYRRMGMLTEVERVFKGTPLLFMGKKLLP